MEIEVIKHTSSDDSTLVITQGASKQLIEQAERRGWEAARAGDWSEDIPTEYVDKHETFEEWKAAQEKKS